MPDLKLSQVADIIGVRVGTLRRLARQGRLEGAYRVGGEWRVNRKALATLRREEEVTGGP